MLQKYQEMEQRLEDSERQVEEQKVALEESQGKSALASSVIISAQNQVVIEEKQLEKVEKAFSSNQMMQYGDNMGGEIGVRKIQELLLDSEGASKNLSKPMIAHY